MFVGVSAQLSAEARMILAGEPTRSTAMRSDETYQVGRGRPPLHSRYKPGQSGNPKGRPKRRRSFAMDIAAALDAPAGAGGDKTKQQTMAEDLVNAALARNGLALKIVTPIALALDGDEPESDAPTPQEQKLIEDFNRRQDSAVPMNSDSQHGDHDD
jgi:Family of unknown function (DUF5681)